MPPFRPPCLAAWRRRSPVVWMQEYDPLGSWPISTAAAALPILVLLGLLASGCVSAGRSALAGLVSACLVAFFIFGMPARMIVASAAGGMVFAAFPLVWPILPPPFLFRPPA